MSAPHLDKSDTAEPAAPQSKVRLGTNMEDVDWLGWLRASEAGSLLQEHIACTQLRNDAQSYEGAAEDCCTWRRIFIKLLNNALIRGRVPAFLPKRKPSERRLPRYIAIVNLSGRKMILYSEHSCLFRVLTRHSHKANSENIFRTHQMFREHLADPRRSVLLCYSLPWQVGYNQYYWEAFSIEVQEQAIEKCLAEKIESQRAVRDRMLSWSCFAKSVFPAEATLGINGLEELTDLECSKYAHVHIGSKLMNAFEAQFQGVCLDVNPDATTYHPMRSGEGQDGNDSHVQILNDRLKIELKKERKEKEELAARLAKALAGPTAPPASAASTDVLVVPVAAAAEKGRKKKGQKVEASSEEQLETLQARLDALELEKVQIAEARNLAEDSVKKLKAEASSKDETYKENKRSMKATLATSRSEVDKLKAQLDDKAEHMRVATAASNDAHAAAIGKHADSYKKLEGEFHDQKQMLRAMGETIMTLQEELEKLRATLQEKEALLAVSKETIEANERGLAGGREHIKLQVQKNEAMAQQHAQALGEKEAEIRRLQAALEQRPDEGASPEPDAKDAKPPDERDPNSPSSTGTTSPPGTFVPIPQPATPVPAAQYTHVQYDDVTYFRPCGLVDAELAVLTAEASLQQLIQWTRHLNGTGGGRMPPPISQMQMPWTPPVEQSPSPHHSAAMGKGGRGWAGRGKGAVAGGVAGGVAGRGKGM